MVERWRFTGCATSFLYQPHETISSTATLTDKHKLFIKFKSLPNQIGYEALFTDFNGHLWRETLIGQELQDRLKSEASGLEIETSDLLQLLDQMCQNFIESCCETSSDLKNLILKTSVKIGFIKLKWTFKAESCGGYNEMIKGDFLLPFFANLRADKVIRREFDDDELNLFYLTLMPNLNLESQSSCQSQETAASSSNLSSDSSNSCSLRAILTPPPPPIPIELLESPETEEMKRKALEEQLQPGKKKKKRLI